MQKKVNTAVIGLGSMGRIHAEMYTLIPEANLRAVCDSRGNIAKEVASKYGVDYYTDYEDLLEREDIDSVDVVLPHYLHAQVAIDSARAGKHVAVEKPLCTTLEDANDMLKAVKKAGVSDMYCENLCFAPDYAMAKDIVSSGGIGDVYMMRCREATYFPIEELPDFQPPWFLDTEKSGGGALIDMGIHSITYMRYILDRERVLRVYAEMNVDRFTPYSSKKYENVALVTVRFEHGKLGCIDVTQCTPGPGGFSDRVEIYGDGSIFIDYHGSLKVHSREGYGYSRLWCEVDTKGWSYPVSDQERVHGYWHGLRHFMQCILDNKRPMINFSDGQAALEIALAAYKSAATRRPVSLRLNH